jgi:predicted transport protein
MAYRRIKNFACVEVHPQSGELLVYLKVNPDEVGLEDGFLRDVRKIGHFGTGDLEARLKQPADLERVKGLIERSYDAS